MVIWLFQNKKWEPELYFRISSFDFWEPWLWTLRKTGLMTGWGVGAISNTRPTVVLTEGQLLWVSIWHTPIQPITTSQLGNTQILHYTCKIGYAYLIRVVCSATSGLGYEATTLKCTPATPWFWTTFSKFWTLYGLGNQWEVTGYQKKPRHSNQQPQADYRTYLTSFHL